MISPSDSDTTKTPEESPSYIPAHRDTEFLQREELRSIRVGLELLKPELIQREQGIRSTIVVFGSARLQEETVAKQALQIAEMKAARTPQDPTHQQKVAIAQRQLALSKYYDVAREFGRLVSSTCQVEGRCDYVIVTGGGPGITKPKSGCGCTPKARSPNATRTAAHCA